MSDKHLETALGKYATAYQQGLDCEAIGHGREAFGHYRKIIKTCFDEMLDELIQLLSLPSTENERYAIALARVHQIETVREKLVAIDQIVPARLIPTNLHPLAKLHFTLSEGIELNSDLECLHSANEYRKILIDLVSEVVATRESGQRFINTMRQLHQLSKDANA
jgi:hypothetical protein